MIKKQSKLVLSYNICFQAMCHSARGSASTLGGKCEWIVVDQLTICAQNMANFLDGVPQAYGYDNFDLVGLQEANKVKFMKAAASKSLDQLEMIYSQSAATHHANKMHMASFYNKQKYTLIDVACSQFNSHHTDRPFHILILEDVKTQEKIVFINVHAPHGSTKNEKYPAYEYRDFEALSHDISDEASKMAHFDSTENYKIIMTGDFNETGWNWMSKTVIPNSWQPLKYAGVKTSVEIANVVFSCSQSTGCWHSANGDRGGDYVFSSGTAAQIEVPTNYVFAPAGACDDDTIMKTILQSDHLPVLSEI